MKLVIDNVSKNFIDPQGKQLSVLENVSLTVHSEEFVALVGPSGCGKSAQSYSRVAVTKRWEYLFHRSDGRPYSCYGHRLPGNRPVSLAQRL